MIFIEMVELLIKLKADPGSMSVLTNHVYSGRIEVCEAILQRFPEAVSYPASGPSFKAYFPLHHASWRGSIDAVDLLLRYNADCHIATGDGNTALGLACHADSIDCAKRFISLGCDPNVADKDKDTALIYATFNGNPEITRLLLDNGADPHAENSTRVTPLWNAVYCQSLDIVKQLLKLNVDWSINSRGSDIHACSSIYDEEVSPVFVALHLEQISILKALFESGCYLHKEIYVVKGPELTIDYMESWAEDNKRWLKHITQNPPSLMWWCKKTIRSRIKSDFQNSVRKLSITSCMKSYVIEVG